MRATFLTSLFALMLATGQPVAAQTQWRASAPAAYTGLCDASALVPVSSNLFLVATDEDNVLRLYRVPGDGAPVQHFDLTRFLELDKKGPEADIEAATLVGNRAFWIGSHGLNREAAPRPNRCRFFATDLRLENGKLTVQTVGRPYKSLLKYLLAEPTMSNFGLSAAVRIRPKDEDGLNIEGLVAAPDGSLLIGFRNPIPQGKALLVPLNNPNEVVVGAAPKLGTPILIDLGGLGIRDMAPAENGFHLLAGPYGSGGPHRLAHWSGLGASVKVAQISFEGLNPEAIAVVPQKEGRILLVLSDDGTVKTGKRECKQMKNPVQRSFRALRLERD